MDNVFTSHRSSEAKKSPLGREGVAPVVTSRVFDIYETSWNDIIHVNCRCWHSYVPWSYVLHTLTCMGLTQHFPATSKQEFRYYSNMIMRACKWSSCCFLWYVIWWPLWSLKIRQNGCIPGSAFILSRHHQTSLIHTWGPYQTLWRSILDQFWLIVCRERERETSQKMRPQFFFQNVR